MSIINIKKKRKNEKKYYYIIQSFIVIEPHMVKTYRNENTIHFRLSAIVRAAKRADVRKLTYIVL